MLGGDFRGVAQRTCCNSDGERSCIVSVPVIPQLETVLMGDAANVRMCQMPKTFTCLLL